MLELTSLSRLEFEGGFGFVDSSPATVLLQTRLTAQHFRYGYLLHLCRGTELHVTAMNTCIISKIFRVISFFTEEQIHFTGFALLVLMIYVKKLELIQVARLVRYLHLPYHFSLT